MTKQITIQPRGKDVFGQWLNEECDVEIGNAWKWEAIRPLFASWSAYAIRGNNRPGSVKAFSEQLRARGFDKVIKGHTKIYGYAGIRLKTHLKRAA